MFLGDKDRTPAGVLLLAHRHLLRGKILSGKTQHLGLDAQQNVLGDQGGLALGLPDGLADLKNPAVIGASWQPVGKGDIHAIGLHPQPSAAGQRNACEKIPLHAQFFQAADGLSRVGSLLSVGAFQPVQFFQHHQGQNNLVVLEHLQCGGGLKQNAGVQYIGLFHGEVPAFPTQEVLAVFIVKDGDGGFHPPLVKFMANSCVFGAPPTAKTALTGTVRLGRKCLI